MTIHEQFEKDVTAMGFDVFPHFPPILVGISRPCILVSDPMERDEVLSKLDCVCGYDPNGNGFWIFPVQPNIHLDDISEVSSTDARRTLRKVLELAPEQIEEYQPGKTATPIFLVDGIYYTVVFHHTQLPEGYVWDKAATKLEGFGSFHAVVPAKPEEAPARQESAPLTVQQMRNILNVLPEKYNNSQFTISGFVLIDADPVHQVHALTRKPIGEPFIELKFRKIL